jgi:hypothetical protein
LSGTAIRRRLASSPEAILKSLERRHPLPEEVPARVLDDVSEGAGPCLCTLRLIYSVLHGLVLSVWREDEI